MYDKSENHTIWPATDEIKNLAGTIGLPPNTNSFAWDPRWVVANPRKISDLTFTYSPKYQVSGSVSRGDYPNQEWLKLRAEVFHDGTAIIMVQKYSPKLGEVEFWFAGCEHQYKSLSVEQAAAKGVAHFGKCYHVEECQKCGNLWAYDSSD